MQRNVSRWGWGTDRTKAVLTSPNAQPSQPNDPPAASVPNSPEAWSRLHTKYQELPFG